MSTPTIRALLFDDSSADTELIVERLSSTGLEIEPCRVDSAAGFERALEDFEPDVILSDHGVPGFGGLQALASAKERAPTTPFIVVSGTVDPEAVVASLRAGADDVVSKDDLERLPVVIERAFALRRSLRTLTDRQLEVLQLIVRGFTTPAIADHLEISAKTVQTHRTALMRRLQVHDISSLVRFAVKVRLLPPNGEL